MDSDDGRKVDGWVTLQREGWPRETNGRRGDSERASKQAAQIAAL